MALAARNRDFAGAANAQGKVDNAKRRLAEALEAEEEDLEIEGTETKDSTEEANLCGYESRAQLESDIADLMVQIEKAVDTKNFSKASKLQDALAEKEKIRIYFPR